jgi:hypothetical protein
MKHLVRGGVAILCALMLSACASLITGGPLIRPGEPTGIIRVSNASPYIVDVVVISTCSASTYGLNRLPDGMAIPPGRSYDFTVSAGCWDVGAGSVSGGGQQAYQRMSVRAGGGVNYTVH